MTFAEMARQVRAGQPIVYTAGKMPRTSRHVTCWACRRRAGYCWDHCHAHTFVRGWACGRCNLVFAELDAGRAAYYLTADDHAMFTAWRTRCPACASGGQPLTAS